jgi:hypothetical protein
MWHLESAAAKILAAFHAFFFFKKIGLQNIILEGDALRVVIGLKQ